MPKNLDLDTISSENLYFYKCLMINIDAMDEIGNFTIDKFVKSNMNTPAEVFPRFQKCMKDSQMDNSCQSAKSFYKCILFIKIY